MSFAHSAERKKQQAMHIMALSRLSLHFDEPAYLPSRNEVKKNGVKIARRTIYLEVTSRRWALVTAHHYSRTHSFGTVGGINPLIASLPGQLRFIE